MVGQSVLGACLRDDAITEVLSIGRSSCGRTHPKLRELLRKDLFSVDVPDAELAGYDACFFCLGVSSVGMNEADYTRLTYDLTLAWARPLARVNPGMAFFYVSGVGTGGKAMWARVKGKTENALMRCAFRRVYNFRPGFMRPTPGQQNVKWYYKGLGSLYPVLRILFPNRVSTMRDVGLAMIHSVLKGYPKQILEIKDINALAKP